MGLLVSRERGTSTRSWVGVSRLAVYLSDHKVTSNLFFYLKSVYSLETLVLEKYSMSNLPKRSRSREEQLGLLLAYCLPTEPYVPYLIPDAEAR